jgi:2-keto-4-pentenoate hydratase/2-oxohepta-3-ene-1,7-dioic acid hydratase in catechol pathway
VRIARFSYGEAASASFAFGAIEGDEIAVIDGHPFGEVTLTGRRLPLSGVRLLPPILPSKIVAIGKNYADHAREMGGEPPAEPVMFLKPSTSVIGPAAPIVYPTLSQQVDFEGELAVVIGRLCRDVPVEKATDVVLGYTCANDVTARDLQRSDGQWSRAKGFDTFCPLGPWIDTEVDPSDLAITTTVNGETKQDARTSLLLHDVGELVAFASAVMTLLPGDVILTGTPAGVGPVVPGDEISVTIEGIGTLTNSVVAR